MTMIMTGILAGKEVSVYRGNFNAYIIRNNVYQKKKGWNNMTVRQFIKKVGWVLGCESMPCRAMSVNIGFINGDGEEDETQFDIKAYDTNELADLFKVFCKENKCSDRSVTYIEIAAMAATMDELTGTGTEKFKPGDIVFESNPDSAYEEEYGVREHGAFFGRVTEVNDYDGETTVEVHFPEMPNGTAMDWSYSAKELSHAGSLKNMTLEDFSNKYGVSVLAEYL